MKSNIIEEQPSLNKINIVDDSSEKTCDYDICDPLSYYCSCHAENRCKYELCNPCSYSYGCCGCVCRYTIYDLCSCGYVGNKKTYICNIHDCCRCFSFN